MVKPNVYTVGGTVQANEGGIYISRHADRELLKLCMETTFAYVLTPRQMGKSSLMIRTAEQLIDEGIQAVIIDLTQIGTQLTADEWYSDFLDLVASQLMLSTDVKQWWQSQQSGITLRLTRFFQEVVLAEIAEPIVIFVDEIDTTLSLSFTDDFYAAIRYLYIARSTDSRLRRLSFVLIGVATPADLIRDPKRTPFNIGQRVDLTDFTGEEAMPLAEGLGLPMNNAQQILRWAMDWTGGHPYLTQRLCRALVDQPPDSWSERAVDQVVTNTFFGRMSEQDNNLQFVRDMLTKRAPHLLEQEVLDTYREIYRGKRRVLDEEQSLVKSHLKLSGVVRREDKRLVVRNRIYREVFNWRWIQEHLPETLWQRLKPAVPLIASLLAFSVLTSGLAVYAYGQQRKAEEQTRIADKQRGLAETERKKAVEQTRIADKQRGLAETEREKAVLALKEAEKQRRSARKQAGIAKTQKLQAEKQALLAQKQTLLAETQTGIAQKQTGIAQQEKQRAEQQIRKAEIEQVRTYLALSNSYLLGNQGLQALLESVKAGKILQQSIWQRYLPDKDLWNQVLEQLQKTFLGTREVNNLIGHKGSVNKVVFDRSGSYLATSSEDGEVRLWSRQGQLVAKLKGHQGWISSVAFSPNGTRLATSGADGIVRLWDLQGKQLAELKGHQGIVWKVAFSTDGTQLATSGEDGTVRLWDLQGKQLAELKGHQGPVWETVFSPKRILATRGADGIVRLWDLQGKQLAELKGSQGNVWSLAFSPNGTQLVTGGEDGTVRLWDLQGKQLAELKGHQGAVTTVAFGSESSLVTRDQTGVARLWNLQDKKPIDLKSNQSGVWDVAFNPNNSRVATISEDGIIRLRDLQGNQLIELRGHRGHVWNMAFNPDGTQLATVGEDSSVRLWDLQTNRAEVAIRETKAEERSSIDISPDGSTTVTTINTTVHLWNSQGRKVDEFNVPIEGSFFKETPEFTPDGNHLVFEDDKSTYLWNLATKKLVKLKGSASDARNGSGSLNYYDSKYEGVFSPDGMKLVTQIIENDNWTKYLWTTQGKPLFNGRRLDSVFYGSYGTRIVTIANKDVAQVWNLQGNLLAKTKLPKGGRASSMSPDGNKLAFIVREDTEENIVQIWDIQHNLISWFNSRHESGLGTVFTPDSRQLVTVSRSGGAAGDRAARLWDLKGSKLAELIVQMRSNERGGEILDLSFSPNGKQIAAGSSDGIVYLWDLQGKLLGRLKGPTGRSMRFKFNSDGSRIAIFGVDDIARLWKLSTNQPPQIEVEIKGHQSSLSQLEFSSNGKQIVTGGEDGTVRLWNLNGSQIVKFTIPKPDSNTWWTTDSNKLFFKKNQIVYLSFSNLTIYRWNIGGLDALISRSCDSLNGLLQNGKNISSKDRSLCR